MTDVDELRVSDELFTRLDLRGISQAGLRENAKACILSAIWGSARPDLRISQKIIAIFLIPGGNHALPSQVGRVSHLPSGLCGMADVGRKHPHGVFFPKNAGENALDWGAFRPMVQCWVLRVHLSAVSLLQPAACGAAGSWLAIRNHSLGCFDFAAWNQRAGIFPALPMGGGGNRQSSSRLCNLRHGTAKRPVLGLPLRRRLALFQPRCLLVSVDDFDPQFEPGHYDLWRVSDAALFSCPPASFERPGREFPNAGFCEQPFASGRVCHLCDGYSFSFPCCRCGRANRLAQFVKLPVLGGGADRGFYNVPTPLRRRLCPFAEMAVAAAAEAAAVDHPGPRSARLPDGVGVSGAAELGARPHPDGAPELCAARKGGGLLEPARCSSTAAKPGRFECSSSTVQPSRAQLACCSSRTARTYPLAV